MTVKSTFSLLFAIVLSVLTFTSCTKDQVTDVVGTWERSEIKAGTKGVFLPVPLEEIETYVLPQLNFDVDLTLPEMGFTLLEDGTGTMNFGGVPVNITWQAGAFAGEYFLVDPLDNNIKLEVSGEELYWETTMEQDVQGVVVPVAARIHFVRQ